MNKYQEFHRLKREIINKLSSIQDGDRMDSLSDNMLEDVTNKQTVHACWEMMADLGKLCDELAEMEK